MVIARSCRRRSNLFETVLSQIASLAARARNDGWGYVGVFDSGDGLREFKTDLGLWEEIEPTGTYLGGVGELL